jgi:hypothetical protein
LAAGSCILRRAGVAKPGQRRRSLFLRKKGKGAKLRMNRLVPATLFLRDSWVQIPPPALLISEQQDYFKSYKLVVDSIAGHLTSNVISL